MGLFINKKQHPDVYKTHGAIIEPNQVEYCINTFTEFVKEQKASNKSMNTAIDTISSTQNKHYSQQKRQLDELEHRIYELKTFHREHERVEKQIVTWLQKLESKQESLQKIMQNDQQDKKELFAQIENLTRSQQEVISQIDDLGKTKVIINQRLEMLSNFRDEVMDQFQLVNASNEQMLNKMDEQTNIQNEIAGKITNIEETQLEVIHRVDGQEGIIEKIIHQIDNVRFILFERTSFLEEKIEYLYEQAVAYIQKIKNSITQTTTLEDSEQEEKRDA